MISVIVPIYNIESYLPKTIDSILNQTYTNLEILLIDDGSTDKSGEICDMYALRDRRIRVIHKTNGGVSSARNLGINIATGDYIGFVDGDDLVEPEMYQRLINNAQKYNCDISACRMDTIGIANGVTTIESNSRIYTQDEIIQGYFTEGFIKEMMYSQCNKIFNRKCFEGLEYKQYKYGEDILFIFESVLRINKLYYDNYLGYHYVHRPNSAMTKKFSLNRIDYIKAIREIEKLTDERNEMVHEWVFKHVLVTLRQIIVNDLEEEAATFYNEEIKYLRKNKILCRKLEFKRKIDYMIIVCCPYIYKILKKVGVL